MRRQVSYHLTLDPDVSWQLEQYAFEAGVARNRIINNAVREYISLKRLTEHTDEMIKQGFTDKDVKCLVRKVYKGELGVIKY